MSFASTLARANVGLDAPAISIESHITGGLPSLAIVGLPETTVREAKERVRSALLNCQFEFPQRRTTINLAPADLPKQGGRYDLAIAISLLVASQQLPDKEINNIEFIGELSLTGQLRPVVGVLPAVLKAKEAGHAIIVPSENANEAARVSNALVYSAENLLQVAEHLGGSSRLEPIITNTGSIEEPHYHNDFAQVIGQNSARRALEIAAVGGHNLLFFGPPGSGKSMLANCLPSILPPIEERHFLETAAIYSVAGIRPSHRWGQRPFVAPHHSASAAALIGGGSLPKPGAVSLAHRGVLFLDELPEFKRHALEVLREPMESGEVTIARAQQSLCFPARFQLIAAMNPCPCGYHGDTSSYRKQSCICTPDQIKRYKNRISGPLLDRIDLQISVLNPGPSILHHNEAQESSSSIKQRVIKARNQQLQRQGKCNAELSTTEIKQLCTLDNQQRDLLTHAIERWGLSTRAIYRVLRSARSIADLAASEKVTSSHLKEALSYRQFDRD